MGCPGHMRQKSVTARQTVRRRRQGWNREEHALCTRRFPNAQRLRVVVLADLTRLQQGKCSKFGGWGRHLELLAGKRDAVIEGLAARGAQAVGDGLEVGAGRVVTRRLGGVQVLCGVLQEAVHLCTAAPIRNRELGRFRADIIGQGVYHQ